MLPLPLQQLSLLHQSREQGQHTPAAHETAGHHPKHTLKITTGKHS
jgi:hypothetical protein